MDLDPRIARASPILGQLLRLSKRREVAIYLREGSLWIADFFDGNGELVEPKIWFRFNSAELAAKIESLHRPRVFSCKEDRS